MEIKDIVMKLIGNVDPVGETHADSESFENLKALVELSDHLLDRIHDVYKFNSNSFESSRQKAAHYAKNELRLTSIEYDDLRSPT